MLNRRMIAVGVALLGICGGMLALPAFAQSTAGTRVHGSVVKLDGQQLTIKTDDGKSISATIAAKAIITTNKPSSLSEIKAGDFVASAAVKGADGKLHSTELRIFPEALRGSGEGQRPMDAPNTKMTNATVSEVVAAADNRVLKVKYKGGTSELVVGPDVRITAVVMSEATQLKPGTSVTMTTAKAADGSMTATRIAAN